MATAEPSGVRRVLGGDQSDSVRARGVSTRPPLALTGITKRFSGVTALSNVSLTMRSGTVHALVGENGAGKSTLMRIMSGALQPDAGAIVVNGVTTEFGSPSIAHANGVSLVPQELEIVPALSIAENIFINRLPTRMGMVNRALMNARAQELLERVGAHVSASRTMGDQRPAIQQLVMIARGIEHSATVYIFDEPTAALSQPEVVSLFAVCNELRRQGAAIAYVSHRLPEILELADEVTVLRDGEVVENHSMEGITEDYLISRMVGRPIERFFDRGSRFVGKHETLLSVEGLGHPPYFRDVSFHVKEGEIVGLAGLVGAGRSRVVRALFGADQATEGQVKVEGLPIELRRPQDAIAAGFSFIPEERKEQALVLDMSIANNIAMPHLRWLSRGGWLTQRRIDRRTVDVSRKMKVKAPSVTSHLRTLSGGNQQKVIFARWLLRQPRLYILDEPTRGIDVGAKSEIYEEMGKLAYAGNGVLVVSSSLPELLGICDRIVVMRQGRVVGEVRAADSSEDELLSMAMGAGFSDDARN